MTGKKLKIILDEKGIKYTWFAEKLRISKGLLNLWLNEHSDIPAKYLSDIEKYLKIKTPA